MSDIVILDEQSESSSSPIETPHKKQNVSFIEQLNNMSIGFQNIKLKDKLIFYRLLSTMLNSGMGLVKSV